FLYDKHRESIFDDVRYFPSLGSDDSVIKFDDNNPNYINRATLRALVVQMTSHEVIDYNLICDFFLTYRTFSDSHTVMNLLLIRIIWALQYVHSGAADMEKIGQLVLLRTFVVLRHWILNYFVDDFVSDDKLCDLFALHINRITGHARFMRPDRVFELKIITDLKVHYLTQINEFFGASMRLENKQEVLSSELPLSSDFHNKQKLQKSLTESSIHTNPSFRRLAMLSLYDLKTHHKCLVFENGLTDENPQRSIQNLICHHTSSRMSLNDKVQEFTITRARRAERQPVRISKPKPLASKNNYMNIKNSSLVLKKTARLNNTPANPISPRKLEAGFSTNGQVKLPSCHVSKILPSSPAKKMEIELRDDSLSSPRRGTGATHSMFRSDSTSHKDSFRKVVSGWKKSFYHDSKPGSPFIYPDPQFVSHGDAHGFQPLNEGATEHNRLDTRSDILSARIIDELEFLIRCYVYEMPAESDMHRATVPCARLSSNTSSQESSPPGALLSPRESKSEKHLQNILEKNILRSPYSIDQNPLPDYERLEVLSRISSSEFTREADPSQFSRGSSFHGQVRSIDWNGEDLRFEKSGDMTALDLSFLQSQTHRDENAFVDEFAKNSSSNSSGYRSSDLEKLNDDVNDLSIAMSPKSMKKKPVLLSISQAHETLLSRQHFRYSFGSAHSVHRNDSLKLFITYDSAFSSHADVTEQNAGSTLKKKFGCHDLRKMLRENADESVIDDAVMAALGKKNRLLNVSHLSKILSIRRSIRFSTLCALTELPFNGCDLSVASSSRRREMRLSDVATEYSIFSQTVSFKKNSLRDEFTSFYVSSTTSATVPGIDNHVLKELAAIPDESFSATNPIKSALYKLEGKSGLDLKTNTSMASHDLRTIVSSVRILDEIANAATEDAIEHYSDIKEALVASPLTPIKTRKKGVHMLISASNTNSYLLGASTENAALAGSLNPKLVLEEYSIINDSLKVQTVTETGIHLPFVLSYDPKSLAEHFTIIEKDMLLEIDWRELIELQWNKDLTPVNSWLEIIANDSYYKNNKGVNLVIARFNLMVNWIISEILLTTDEKERIDVISRFIRTAYHCFAMQNFATLMQIILALTSERLNKLPNTWNQLAPGDILTLKNLEKLASPLRNFYNIRLSTNESVPSRGCIPFVGLYLSDLVFNAERPNGILPDKEQMINFSRFRTSVHIVKSLSQSIEWASQYDFAVDEELLRKCLYIKSLDEDEMKLCVE
ncbi:ras GEF, partial [Metschnikowia bicuspidata]